MHCGQRAEHVINQVLPGPGNSLNLTLGAAIFLSGSPGVAFPVGIAHAGK